MNIMLIDENQDNLDSMQEVIETSGHKCDKYRFLEDAKTYLERGQHDAAVVNLCNYGVTSLNIKDDLRDINPKIKLILVNDHDDHNLARKAIIKGAYPKYPLIVGSWRKDWTKITTLINRPPESSKIKYSFNVSERYYQQLRKAAKGGSKLPTKGALLRMTGLAIQDVLRKWTGRIHNWGQTLRQ